MHRLLPTALLGLNMGCGQPEDCGKVESCPVGTVVEAYSQYREGLEINGDVSSTAGLYDGGVAFRHFESGTCEWACVAIQECEPPAFPIITEDCFTCGLMSEEGEVVQPECGP